jgi:hypothetical protein
LVCACTWQESGTSTYLLARLRPFSAGKASVQTFLSLRVLTYGGLPWIMKSFLMIFFLQPCLLNSVIVILFIVSFRPSSTCHSGIGARSFSKWNCSDVGFVWFVLRTCLLLVCCSPIHVRLQPIIQRIKKTGRVSKKEACFRIWFTFSSAPARLF